jgi:alanyl-tRNA synthetase
MDFHSGEVLRGALAEHGLRGGGSADLAQGDAPKAEAEKIVATMAANLRSLLARPHTEN